MWNFQVLLIYRQSPVKSPDIKNIIVGTLIYPNIHLNNNNIIITVVVPYPQLQGYSNLSGNCKDFSISYVLEMMLDNNTFKHLDHCVSHRIQRRE